MRRSWFIWSVLPAILALIAPALFGAEPADPGIEFFERKIRPLLAENCFSCHGAEKQKGGLRLDSPAAIRAGGESGPIFVPGKPGESRLIMAVSYQSEDLKMPPKTRLSARQVADLTEWIAQGALMPASDSSVTTPIRKEFEITEKDREHWAFKPVKRPVAPAATGNPIDALVSEVLKRHGLTLSPIATPRELIRRAYFDLIGLPPTPEAVAAFEKNHSPRAYEKLIDDLLARPQYGERWGRHWLDIARFAQSDGYERDGEKPLAWRYRDYVVQAFNRDKPYDRFVMEQIAGDELPDATAESVCATGFQRLGVFDDEPDDKVMAEYDALDDILSTTGSAFLGITLGCARCHDHKFDPIPQTDYYSMLAFFRNIRPYESAHKSFASPGFAPLASPAEVGRWLAKTLPEFQSEPTDEKGKKDFEQKLIELRDKAPFEWTLAVRERGTTPPVTRLLARGNPSTPGAEAPPAFLRIISDSKPLAVAPPAHGMSCGRRLALAEWIASPQNPLTARVMVNRVWQHHFGRGLVKTTSDFGRAGSPPSHPELLDWLAAEFMESGWSVKKLHKQIMLSQTYRQSSRAVNRHALELDPGNDLLWRQNLRRLEAESVRDSILSIAGTLNPKMGGRGFFPHLSGEVLAGQSRPGLDWAISTEAEKSRRSIYAFVRRTMPIPLLETLDYSNTTSPLSERAITTVAPQALILLNDDFLHQQAAAFADRLVHDAGNDPGQQIQRAYALAMNRVPGSEEMKISRAWIERQKIAFAALESQITFQPDVASALSSDYFKLLEPAQFLIGPKQGWTSHRGFWAPPYEGIRVVDRDRSPFALFERTRIENGVIEGSIQFSASTELAGVFLRAKADGDLARGYEIVFDLRGQKLLLRKHEAEIKTLAETTAALPILKSIHLKIVLSASQITVVVDGSANLAWNIFDAKPAEFGNQFGVRAWGGSITLDQMSFQPSESSPIRIHSPLDSAHRALQSFALLVLNLNEVVYVD